VLFKAIPIRERYVSAALDTLPDLVPHYTDYHPGFVTGGNAREYNLARPALPPIDRWRGWELLVRSLISHDNYPLAANRTTAIVEPNGSCHCFRRLLGGSARFWPSVLNKTALRLARPRVRDFRLAFLRNLGAAAPGADVQCRIIFVLRHRGPRQIVNEDVLRKQLANAAEINVRFVVFDELQLLQQHALATTSTGLAGVHGAALAWTAFLPSGDGHWCSLLELMPVQVTKTHSIYDYLRLAAMNDVEYHQLVQPDAPECVGKYFRVCGNITTTDKVVPKLRQMTRACQTRQIAGGRGSA
jgi:hypothetical protein